MSWLRRTVLSFAAGLTLLGAIPAAVPGSEPDPDLGLPGLRVLGGNGWHAEGEFRLAWDRPAGAPAPQVVAVDYLVRDAAGALVVPTVRIEEQNPSTVFISVPRHAGKYTAEVWLEGEEREGPRSEAKLRFDPDPPAPARPLTPAGWVRAGVPIGITLVHPARPWPESGIRGYAIAVGGEEGPEPCAGPARCTTEEIDLAGGPDDDTISIDPLPEGTSFVRSYAVSGAEVRSPRVETAALHADGSGPTVAFDQVPLGWVDGPVSITAQATDRLSGMAPDGPSLARTEIVVDGAPVSVAPGPRASTVVSGEGLHALLASARDAVGNPSAGAQPAGPVTAVVRIDETPPHVAFLPRPDPAEPERIEALVIDSLAGPDPRRGSIAVRPQGDRGPFSPISTTVAGSRLVASWNSDSFPPGRYEFAAIAYDRAGNRAIASMGLSNPVKAPTSLLTGFGGRRALAQTCRRQHGAIRCRRHRADAYEKRPARRSTRYGQRIAVGGRLSTATGSPLADREVRVVETFDPGATPERRESSAKTTDDGTFLVRLAAGPSRRIRVEFPGTPLLGRTSSRTLRLAIRAPLRLRSSAATATVGGAPVVFSGTVGPTEAALPKEGLPVELQFRIGAGAWSAFRTVQTDAHGRFRYPYVFADDDSRGVRFQFRAVVSHQPDWPFAAGTSLPVTVAGR